jgi:uncharacterized protein
MTNEEIILKTVEFVKETLNGAEGGHDWFHIERVWKNAKHIGTTEGNADMFVVELGALLHDIADAKFHNGNEEIGPKMAREFLLSLSVDEVIVSHVENIIRFISFKAGFEAKTFTSHELNIVQDALGAIGIARTFNYGGHIGRPLYDPAITPNLSMTKDEYKKSVSPTINHFYEKLFLLMDLMNTETGKQLATQRHKYREDFLIEFFAEWEGEN